MTSYRITVPGEMPGMNEIVAAAKSHYGAYSNMKRAYTVAVQLKAKEKRIPQIDRVVVRCHWVAKNRRRDPDNIEAAVKFVLDGLVEAGILPGDGWRHIAGIEHTFSVDRHRPRVEIEVIEAQDATA